MKGILIIIPNFYSDLYARFIVHPIEKEYADLGKVSTDHDRGQILPHSTVKLNVSLITECLKSFKMNLIIEIVSDTNIQEIIIIKVKI